MPTLFSKKLVLTPEKYVDNVSNVSFEEMDIQWDDTKNCFVVGKKKRSEK